jgi:hypothetical protein
MTDGDTSIKKKDVEGKLEVGKLVSQFKTVWAGHSD